MTKKKIVEVAELEKRFQEMSARHKEQEAALLEITTRLEALPGRLVDSADRERGKLVSEFGKTEAQHKLLALEVEELARRRDSVWGEVLVERVRLAEVDLETFEQTTLFPQKRAAEAAGDAVRIAINSQNRHASGEKLSIEEIEALRVAKAVAESKLRLAAARRRELRNVRDNRRSELDQYRKERDGT